MNGYPVPPLVMTDAIEHRRQIVQSLYRTIAGKLNAVTTVTLNPNATSTTLTDNRIGPSTYIGFSPTTAHAAAAVTSLYVSAQQNGSATLTHANSANTDQTFSVVLIG